MTEEEEEDIKDIMDAAGYILWTIFIGLLLAFWVNGLIAI